MTFFWCARRDLNAFYYACFFEARLEKTGNRGCLRRRVADLVSRNGSRKLCKLKDGSDGKNQSSNLLCCVFHGRGENVGVDAHRCSEVLVT